MTLKNCILFLIFYISASNLSAQVKGLEPPPKNIDNKQKAPSDTGISLQNINKQEAEKKRIALKAQDLANADNAYRTKNYNDAAKLYLKYQNELDAIQMCHLGDMYHSGLGGLNQDYDYALSWYAKSIAKGNPIAMYNTGSIYEQGGGSIKQNMEKAIEYYQISCDAGYKDGCEQIKKINKNIATSREKEQKINIELMERELNAATVAVGKRNFAYAASIYLKYPDELNDTQMYFLGRMYHDGEGVKQNRDEAKKWYNKAIQKNSRNGAALFYLGKVYHDGGENSTAFRYYEQSCKAGYLEACEHVYAE